MAHLKDLVVNGNSRTLGTSYATNYSGKWEGISNDIHTENTSDTWVPVLTNGVLQHRVIPAAYNNDPSTLSVNYAKTSGTANNVAWGGVTGKPATYTPASHTHAISDISNLQNTINSINSNKADLSYVNNKVGDMNYSRVSLGGGNTANYPYHRFLSVQNITYEYTDITGIYLIDKKFDGGQYGIVKVTIRTNDKVSSYQISAKWLVRSSSQNPADIVFGSYLHDGKLDVDVFIKCGQWPRTYIYNILGHSDWTMMNSSEVDNTTTSDRKTSTECYSSLTDAGSKIHSAAYSTTGTATDDGGVLNATRADNAANATKFNGYTGDFGTNNTNDTWVPVIVSGKMQHRAIPAAYNNDPSTLSVRYAATAGSANAVAWANVNGKPELAYVSGSSDLPSSYTGGDVWKAPS